ncbi:MAG: hypothetical protein CVV53_04235 [Spirochaetae bacterium HGW-Spirochaetae-9]|nr:MAG: hypothetical protein CVV53_04235 [Spirochaetae bacterium HGW-Spirochaetae-9]
MPRPAVIVLEDGAIFTGEALAGAGTVGGEIVFTTSMGGYQEIATDPSYCGQLVTYTFPMNGNYGADPERDESGKAHARAVIAREITNYRFNRASRLTWLDWLAEHGVLAVSGVDTRALTRHIREKGALRAVVSSEAREPRGLRKAAQGLPKMGGLDLARVVTCETPYEAPAPLGAPAPDLHVVAYDFGVKRSMLGHLAERGFRVTVVPAQTSAREVLKRKPDGVFLSNGPGDPAAVGYAVKAVELFVGRSNVQDFDPASRDYIAWHCDGDLVAFIVFTMRDGRMKGRDSFIAPLYGTEEEAIQSFLVSYYSAERLPPPSIYLMKTTATKPVAQYIRRELGVKTRFLIPKEQRHAASMNLAIQNAREEMIKKRREIGDTQALVELRSALGLASLPMRIEGFDIAHLAGKNTVASLISFKNGIPDKRNYRYFRIKSLGKGAIDDFASIREAVARRYTRLVNEEAELPDLILIDGGAGQVSAAKEILDHLGLDCELAGLAKKNEEVYLPDRLAPIVLPMDSPALRVLVAIRDETHRFATGLSKKLRTRDLRFTLLTSVEGIGEARAKRLMKAFGSMAAIAAAEAETIARAAGVSLEIALAVKEKASLSYGAD